MKLLHQVLDAMRLPNGAYLASRSHDYSYVWVRDVCYTVMPYLCSDCKRYEQAYHSLLDLFLRYEWKIDIHTKQKPNFSYEYLHSRYSKDLYELPDPWGHAQNDAIGLFLWGVGQGFYHGKQILRDQADLRILQKLVDYLACLRYWQEPDNGMWEECVELHASSIGACVAGLKSVQMLVDVSEELIQNGERSLRELLPRESITKNTDLALLSLIFPYQIVSRKMAFLILEQAAQELERNYGCIRYKGDQYYNEGREAEWCFGFPWIGLCYSILGEREKTQLYWEKTKNIIPANGEVPELYIGGASKPNGNQPLAWAVSFVIMLYERVMNFKVGVLS